MSRAPRKPRDPRRDTTPSFLEPQIYESQEELRATFLQLSKLVGSPVIVESNRHGDIDLSAGVLDSIHMAEKTQMVELVVDGRELKLNRAPGRIRIAQGLRNEAGELNFTDIFWGVGAPPPEFEI